MTVPRIAPFLLALCVAVLWAGAAAGTLRVDRFDLNLDLQPDGAFRIQETLTVTFATPHHGIERWIPVSYDIPTWGTRTNIDVDVQSVTLDGGNVPVLTRRRGADLYLRIGDPDVTIRDTHVYEITYLVTNALLFQDEALEIYWNVTGHEWRVPIDAATARVCLPAEIPTASVSTISYAGYAGSTSRGEGAVLDEAGCFTFSTGSLVPGEGLTIALAFPKEALPIAPPSLASRILRFLRTNLAALIPIVTLIGMFLLWWRIGRDPRKRAIAPTFALPRDMHAGVAGVLIDDQIDIRDISGMIVGLAVKGFLRIEEVHEEGDGAAKRSTPLDFLFVRRDRSTEELSGAEVAVLEALFESDGTSTTLSSLESRFYKHLPGIKSRLYSSLIEQGYYGSNPERTRASYRGLALIPVALAAASIFYWHSAYLAIMFGLSALVVLAFSPIMPRKTQEGVRAMEQVLGLSRYIRLAEVSRIEFHNAPEKSPETFERMLPYAIALNLTKIWSDQFADLLKTPPEWYGGGSTFRGHAFTLSLWHLSAGLNRTLATAPRTSAGGGKGAWGGGSGFSGGFSGGGFGGGGGGGW